MSTEGGTKAVLAALLANLGIAATKLLAFFLNGFSSMLAEAIHSLADSGNQVLLLVGGKKLQREATPQHPFGFGPGAVRLLLHRLDRVVQPGWALRPVRGVAQVPGDER